METLLSKNQNLEDVTELIVQSIVELLQWMFSLTYCEYDGNHYILDCGLIGLGATGEIAIIYMEDFQLRAMETSPCPLNQWYWYVDDSEIKSKKGEALVILDHLNSIEPDVIVFTKEEQDGEALPVLDLKQMIDRKTKKIQCTVHYKQTHTNINIKEKSIHLEGMKKGVISQRFCRQGTSIM